MKKFIALVLASVLAALSLSMVSCFNNKETAETLVGKTPEELYAESQEKLLEAKSYSIVTTQVIVMKQGKQTLTMNQVVTSEQNGLDSHVKTTNDFDNSLNIEAWYVDGIVYGSMFGVKVKEAMDKEEFMQQYMDKDPSESTLLDIPESWYKDIKFEKADDDWFIKFIIDGDKYTEYFSNIGLGGTLTGDVTYKVLFDEDGNLEKIITSFDMSISGVSAHCDSVSTVTIGNVNITPPADADSYIEA